MFPFGFFLAPAILWIILFIIARNHGDRSYLTLFYVSLGVTVISWVSAICIPHFTIIVVPIVCVLAIQKFCYIGWFRSIIATILYTVWLIVWPILFNRAMH
jgi:uncharacterized membrane protein